jgi:hypothetical protein
MDVALIGLIVPELENHSLGALRGALEGAGRSATLVPFRGWADLAQACRAVLASRARVCGISIQSTEAAVTSLALARTLRAQGFRGTIVAGGHFATIDAGGVLEACPEVDAVVRFAGEEAIVALARGDAWRDVPGLVFRGAGGVVYGAPPRVSPPLHTPARDAALPEHLGFPAADLVASHGCLERCAYCCVAGKSAMAAREASRAGGDPERVREARYARRDVEALADEVAALFHERGVRVLNFMDDNVLPRESEDAAAWARAFASALASRSVPEIAFSMQLRADVVTSDVARALAEVGLVRAYVGIDGWSSGHLRELGRRAPAEAAQAALDRLADRGIFSMCNALIVGPTFRFESVLAEIEALTRVRGAPVHLLKLDVRAGSAYFELARRRGLLEGGPVLWHYRFVDDRTELFGELVTSLPTRLAERSVPMGLYDLGYNLGVARRLLPELDVSAQAEVYGRVTEAWNADQARLLRLAAELAGRRDKGGLAALRDRELPYLRAFDGALLGACDRALADVERAVSRAKTRRVRAHARSRILSAIAMTMGLSACGKLETAQPNPGSVGDAGQSGDAGPDSPFGSDTDAAPVDGSMPGYDAAAVDASCLDGGESCTPFTDVGPKASVACGDLCGMPLEATFDANGVVVDVRSAGTVPLDPAIRDCILAILSKYTYPSLAGTTQTFGPHCWVA